MESSSRCLPDAQADKTSASRDRLRAQVKAEQDAKPFPDYPSDGSLRHCRRAKWFGGGLIRHGVAQLVFGVEGVAEPVYLLLSEQDMRAIAAAVAESQEKPEAAE